jgi:hypothetical protein
MHDDPHDDAGRVAYDLGRAYGAEWVPDTLLDRATSHELIMASEAVHEGWKLWGPDGPTGPSVDGFFFTDRLWAWLCWKGLGEPEDVVLVQACDPKIDRREIEHEGLGDDELYALLERIATEQRPWLTPLAAEEAGEGEATDDGADVASSARVSVPFRVISGGQKAV